MIEEGENRKADYFINNVVNHGRLLASALSAGVRNLIYSGTAGVYAPSSLPVSEGCRRSPATWYGQTKMLAEDMLYALAKAGLLRAVVFRYFSVAGAGWGVYEKRDYDEHVIIRLMRSALTGDRFVLNGSDHPTRDGSPIRDFVSVKDVATAHVAAAERMLGESLPAFTVVNLGTGKGTTILELVHLVEAVTGRTISVEPGPPRPAEPSVMLCDYSEAERLLNWSPRRELQGTLRELWELWTAGGRA
jgi:UDP-glucose 4-epimerase